MTLPPSDLPEQVFKVVWVDGYNRETVSDVLVEDGLSFAAAHELRDRLRRESGSESDWWMVKPQQAPLWRGVAEFG